MCFAKGSQDVLRSQTKENPGRLPMARCGRRPGWLLQRKTQQVSACMGDARNPSSSVPKAGEWRRRKSPVTMDEMSGPVGQGLQGQLQEVPPVRKGGQARIGTSFCGLSQSKVTEKALEQSGA